jgi:hypothetical protein
MLNPVIADVALSVVPKERSGMAAGVNDTFRQVGVALGTALWGAIFLARGTSTVGTLLAGTPDGVEGRPRQLVESFSGGGLAAATHSLPIGARAAAVDATRQGFLSGLNLILTIGGFVAIGAAVLAFWLVREREIDRGEEVEVVTEGREMLVYSGA